MILWLLACGGPPELAAERRAVEAFRVGREELDRSPVDARAAFERARIERPDEPLLTAWVARARAREGDLDGAIEELEALLAKRPGFGVGHYNLACWLARQGRLDASATALRRALELGATSAKEVASDSDLSPWRDHPAFAFLPTELLTVVVDAPTGAVFWGSTVSVRLKVLGSDGHPVHVATEQADGPLELVGVTENVFESSDGRSRDLRFDFRVVGAGPVVLGPWTVQAGPWTQAVPVVTFDAGAPPGKEGMSHSLDLSTPSQRRGGWACVPDCEVAPERPIRRGTDVLASGTARVLPGSQRRYTFKVADQPQWTLHEVGTAEVTVVEGKERYVLPPS